MKKVYSFWSRRKNSGDRYVTTELMANSKAEVREWAKENNIEIENNKIYLKK